MSSIHQIERLRLLIDQGLVSKDTCTYFSNFYDLEIIDCDISGYHSDLDSFPLISIIIPTFNRIEMLMKAIKSVQSQSYPSLELIVINDCSTDGTYDYLQSLVLSKGTLKVIHNIENLNAGKNRQLGFHISSGDFVLFLDDDDFYTDTDFYSKAVKAFQSNVDLAFVSANSFIQNRDVLTLSEIEISGRIEKSTYLNGFQFEIKKPNSTFTTLFSREKLVSMGFDSMIMMNDVSIYLRALLTGDAYILRDIVGVYLIHGSNISFDIKPEFLIQNMQEKLFVFNNSENKGVQLREIWLKRHLQSSLKYFILGSNPSFDQISLVYRWIWQNVSQFRIVLLLSIMKFSLVRLKRIFKI